MRKFAATAILAMMMATPALAHAHLESSNPAANATVTPAPSELSLDLSEEVEPKFSSIEVTDAKGARVDKADTHIDGSNAKRLVVSLKPLSPGSYKVMWRATSTDTHKTNGNFTFKVGG